ncbi:MAG: metalloregulator ArsR/SmtB family transcription factor [Solirubrobacteraceae bacterium]
MKLLNTVVEIGDVAVQRHAHLSQDPAHAAPSFRSDIFPMQNTMFSMDVSVLSALAEPNRLRIAELLNLAPRSVGEVADELGLRQPQVTKHLQTLERAGVVTMHALGRRRIYAIRREPIRELGQWLEAFEANHPSHDMLEQYARAIASERDHAARDPNWALRRLIRLQRRLPAPVDDVWEHWTSATLIRRWWSPEHFEVAACEVDAVENGRLEIVMQEGDGERYYSRGRFLTIKPKQRIRFELSHLGADGASVFTAIHNLRLQEHGQQTQLSLAIRTTAASPTAAAAIAGIQIGWKQLLTKLAQTLIADNRPGT